MTAVRLVRGKPRPAPRWRVRGLAAASLVLAAVFTVLPVSATAIPDEVTLSVNNEPDTTVFGDNSLVKVQVSDHALLGGSSTAVVTDTIGGDSISITVYEEGTAPDDNADDTIYWGEFTIVDDNGISGQFTDDVAEIVDLAHGALGNVSIDMDGAETAPPCCGIDFTTD